MKKRNEERMEREMLERGKTEAKEGKMEVRRGKKEEMGGDHDENRDKEEWVKRGKGEQKRKGRREEMQDEATKSK